MGVIQVLFFINVSLILVHEMDAIRCKEWKMFIILKDIKEEYGYLIFTLLHLPIYFLCLASIFNYIKYLNSREYIWIDVILILHSIVHFLFRKNKNNKFSKLFSQFIIYGISLIAMMRIILILCN